MFVSYLLQFNWNCLRMTLRAYKGTKTETSTQTFFLQRFSFEKKKNPNPNPTSISGPLQAVLPSHAPLLSFGFVRELLSLGKHHLSVILQLQPPAAAISAWLIFVVTFWDQGRWRVTLLLSAVGSGSPFCFLRFGCCPCGCSGILKARFWEITSAAGMSLHAAKFWSVTLYFLRTVRT